MTAYHSIQLPASVARVQTALGWAAGQTLAGARSFIIVDRFAEDADAFRDELQRREPGARLVSLCPQRDEFRHGLDGKTWDAAICQSIDLWPMVDSPFRYCPKGWVSFLMERILAHVKGPILCTYAVQEGLAAKMFGATSIVPTFSENTVNESTPPVRRIDDHLIPTRAPDLRRPERKITDPGTLRLGDCLVSARTAAL